VNFKNTSGAGLMRNAENRRLHSPPSLASPDFLSYHGQSGSFSSSAEWKVETESKKLHGLARLNAGCGCRTSGAFALVTLVGVRVL
jgi:hypothetical protein